MDEIIDYYEELKRYLNHLKEEEKSENTISKYERDIKYFLSFLKGRSLTKEVTVEYKCVLEEGYAPSSVNSMLAAINNFFIWLNQPHLKVKPLKIQKEIFSNPEKELSKSEYERLVRAADALGNRKLSLILQTICSTGIRISELEYITVESVYTRRALVSCKGKKRVVFLSKELCKALKQYIKDHKLTEGSIFKTRTGQPLDRSNIWRMMKNLCKHANVKPTKVFPHNLRHLFARMYYRIEKDISKLADILGHSNINTTRIYMIESGNKHIRQLERMQLVVSIT